MGEPVRVSETDDCRKRMETLFRFSLENRVSDLFITAGTVPSCRVDKNVCQVEFPVFTSAEIDEFRNSLLSDDAKAQYARTRGIDISFACDENNRFRLNFFDSVKSVVQIFYFVAVAVEHASRSNRKGAAEAAP